MIALPKKRKAPRSGIERAPAREWPRHRAFVRRHQCVVPGCEDGPIECAHVRTAANAGTGIKPHDAHTVSMCRAHHKESHDAGVVTFERKYRVDLVALAKAFALRSPILEVRDYARG